MLLEVDTMNNVLKLIIFENIRAKVDILGINNYGASKDLIFI